MARAYRNLTNQEMTNLRKAMKLSTKNIVVILLVIFAHAHLLSGACLQVDINSDQETDLTDAVLLLQILAGRSRSTPIPHSDIPDINGDGKTGLAEMVYLLQFLSGEIDCPPIEMVTVPEVINLSQAAAQAVITDAQLTIGSITEEYSVSVLTGTVITQQPAAGTLAPKGSEISLVLSAGPPLPPDPTEVAPTIELTQATTLASATSFLYTGNDPIQSGMSPDTIVDRRAAVIRGHVAAKDNSPIANVRITVLNHPEYGSTRTRQDGSFDMALNGGGSMTIVYEKTGYLTVRRRIAVPWQDFLSLPEVVMIHEDSKVTAITLNASVTQVAQSSTSVDADGARQTSILFPSGTTAELTMADGSTQPVTSLSIRATELTVGANGPESMPAAMPPDIGYTYCVDLTADEAIAAGAEQVRFSQALPVYVENFLGFPVGGAVPLGYFDKKLDMWVPSDNGRVIQILSITGGNADLDIDGSGTNASPAALAALGITIEERTQLALLYMPGQSLWRLPISHFSSWDANWGWGPPLGALAPLLDLAQWIAGLLNDDCSPCEKNGSIVECQNQILGEAVPVSGTSFDLRYSSDRTPGRKSAYTLKIPLSKDTVPPGLKRIELQVQVAGRSFTESFAPNPNQSYTFTWDGKDGYGRILQGKHPVAINVGYVYDGLYQDPGDLKKAFGYNGNGVPLSVNSRQEIILWQKWKHTIGTWDARSQGLAGWSLDVHHAYDSLGRVFYPGYGGRRDAESVSSVIDTLEEIPEVNPRGLDVGPDGSLYVTSRNSHSIFRVLADGSVETIMGPEAALRYPQDVALGTDGSVYVADSPHHRIRKRAPDGTITTFAGTGVAGFGGDGGPADQALLNEPYGVAVGTNGEVYIADRKNHRIRMVNPDGTIMTIAGSGTAGMSGDGGPASLALLNEPLDIALGPDGSIYLADSIYNHGSVRKISPDGIISTIAGSGTSDPCDGRPATDAKFGGIICIDVSEDGTLYIFSKTSYARAYTVNSSGIINLIAGAKSTITGSLIYGDGGPSVDSSLSEPGGVAVAPDGVVYLADTGNYQRWIRVISSPYPGFELGDIAIPSDDGSQVYRFTPEGRHVTTVNALNGEVIYQFHYNDDDLLMSIEDADANITTIERDSAGNATAIIAPFGQRTELTVTDGWLVRVTDPEDRSHEFTYTADGLMESFTDPGGNVSSFSFDASGRLLKDTNPRTGYSQLSRTDDDNSYTVDLSTAENNTTTYRTEVSAAGVTTKTITLPDGGVNQLVKGTDEKTTITFAGGKVSQQSIGPDPRFGIQLPVTKEFSISQPSGLRSVTEKQLSVDLAEPKDPFSLRTLTDTTTVNGNTFTRSYDADTRSWSVLTPEGRGSSIGVDRLGRPLMLEVPGFDPVNYSYDATGRIDEISQGVRSTKYTYNAGSGYLESVKNALNQAISYQRDKTGRPKAVTFPDMTTFWFDTDANGNLTLLTEPDGATEHRFTYTKTNQLKSYTSPLGAVENYFYDKDERPIRRKYPSGKSSIWQYNAKGQLTGIQTPEGSHSLLYDSGTGMLSSEISRDGQQVDYSYDGSLPIGEQWSGVVSGSITLGYDNFFRMNQMTYPGADLSLSYDLDGLLTGVGTIIIGRDTENGLVDQISDGSYSVDYGRNSFGEITSKTVTHGSTLYESIYSYDKLGRISQMTETLGGATHIKKYVYDGVGRLITVKQDGSSVESYNYDEVGNRIMIRNTLTGQNLNAADFTYDADNKLLSAGTTAYSYDADGRLTQENRNGTITKFQYNTDGTLAKVTLPDNRVISYFHDSQGRRIARDMDGVRTHAWIYGKGLMPLAEFDGAGSLQKSFIYAESATPSAYIAGGQTFHIISDQLGSPRLIVDSIGAVVRRVDYDAFGNVIADSNPSVGLVFGFAGGMADPEHELIRFGARDYQPSMGRWTAKDSILFNGGLNLYGYVANDPVNWVDPKGKKGGYYFYVKMRVLPQVMIHNALNPSHKICIEEAVFLQYLLDQGYLKGKLKDHFPHPVTITTEEIDLITKEILKDIDEGKFPNEPYVKAIGSDG